ncbi:MAG: hypothetical protein EOP45_15680 [Sphingobacteriaceae bacterium]|nr:MAG: hypothetical protein EOP45_15680 [Sphingobacteriaceae bacterium]
MQKQSNRSYFNRRKAAWIYALITNPNTRLKCTINNKQYIYPGSAELRSLKFNTPESKITNIACTGMQGGKSCFQCLAIIKFALQDLYSFLFVLNSGGSGFMTTSTTMLQRLQIAIQNQIEQNYPWLDDERDDDTWRTVFSFSCVDTLKIRKPDFAPKFGSEKGIPIFIGNTNASRLDKILKPIPGLVSTLVFFIYLLGTKCYCRPCLYKISSQEIPMGA